MPKSQYFSVITFIFGIITGFYIEDYILNTNSLDQKKAVIETIDYLSKTEGCEVKEGTTCPSGLICTGISQFSNESKSDFLMAEDKARGFALTHAADFIKRTSNNNQEALDNFIQNYSTLSIKHNLTDKLVYVEIGQKCN